MSFSTSAFKVGNKRTYRERAQPKARRRFGLLEKKADYRLRAKDYKRKQAKLTRLRVAAEMRNPDEFYHGMQNSRAKADGQHEIFDRSRFSADELRLMDEQDLAYLNTRAQEERKKIERMQSSLHGLDDAADEPTSKRRRHKRPAKHVVFVDNEKQVTKFDPVKHFDTVPEAVDRVYNRPRKEALANDNLLVSSGDAKQVRAVLGKRKKSYQELDDRTERLKRIDRMREAMELRKALKGKGRRRRLVSKSKSKNGVAKYKWSKERKK